MRVNFRNFHTVISFYSVRSSGKLKLKGEKKKSKKDKKDKKRKHEESIQDEVRQKFREDRNLHGGWWKSSTVTEITGPVAIEFGEHSYIKVYYAVQKFKNFPIIQILREINFG